MKAGLILILIALSACNSFDSRLLEDPRFASGRDFETNDKILPKIIHSDPYTLVTGFSKDKSSLGLFYGEKEIFYQTASDGSFDIVLTANLNNDGITDFLITFVYEDGPTLVALTSQSVGVFSYKTIVDQFDDTNCNVAMDTFRNILPLLVKDVNRDHRDDILVNVVKINNSIMAIPCTDTILSP